jgi:ATP-dependent Clp protease protease subunit
MWIYNDLPKLQLDLLEHKIIALSGEIDGKLLSYAREAFLRLDAQGSPDIEIRISSGGGAYLSAMGIYDLIRLYKGKTRGVVYFHAESMASILLQACTERCIPRHSWLLLHHLKVSEYLTLDALRDTPKMKKIKEEVEEHQSVIYKIFTERTDKKEKQISALCKKAKRIYAKEALKLNLVDTII